MKGTGRPEQVNRSNPGNPGPDEVPDCDKAFTEYEEAVRAGDVEKLKAMRKEIQNCLIGQK